MTLDATYEPSPWEPVADQVALYEQTDGAQGAEFMGGPVIILSTIGATSGKLRKTPLIRIEKDGRYAVIGSLGGAPSDPLWTRNLRANPQCRLQDGPTVHDLVAREVTGTEKAEWWAVAMAAYPHFDEYQASTGRVIPLFVLDPSS
jgi:deazaflavin-dependent oxidoreductase (nitroreductase family)